MSLPGYSGQRPHTDLVRRQVHRRRLQLDVHFLDLPEATQPDNTHPGVLLPPAIDCQLAESHFADVLGHRDAGLRRV